MMPPELLNIGCGTACHPAWTNLDFEPKVQGVRPWDLRRGLPFADDRFDGCYHSHVLEHLRPDQARDFMRECKRVLAPGGVIRVAVPDLEAMARAYIDALDRCGSGAAEALADREWMVIEMYDQAVRERSGGRMKDYLADPALPNREFVLKRIGAEAESLMHDATPPPGRRTAGLGQLWMRILSRSRFRLASLVVAAVGGAEARDAFAEGAFRASGEIHRWMYDRISLSAVLRQAGFHDLRVCAPGESRIPHFAEFGLEHSGGSPRKPDSLYMEGVRPPAG